MLNSDETTFNPYGIVDPLEGVLEGDSLDSRSEKNHTLNDFSTPLTCYTATSVRSLPKKTNRCGTEFREIFCKHCGHKETTRIYCHKRTCQTCQEHKSNKLAFEYDDIVRSMNNPKLVTLTMEWSKNLRGGFRKIRKAWRRLLKNKAFARTTRGGIDAVEYIKKPNGSWFLHLHALVDSIYIPQRKLSNLWKGATGSSFIVDIRKAWSPKGGLRYILKYMTKTANFQGYEDEVNSSLRNLRTVGAFGSCYNTPRNVPKLICPHCGRSNWGLVWDGDNGRAAAIESYRQDCMRTLDDFG